MKMTPEQAAKIRGTWDNTDAQSNAQTEALLDIAVHLEELCHEMTQLQTTLRESIGNLAQVTMHARSRR